MYSEEKLIVQICLNFFEVLNYIFGWTLHTHKLSRFLYSKVGTSVFVNTFLRKVLLLSSYSINSGSLCRGLELYLLRNFILLQYFYIFLIICVCSNFKRMCWGSSFELSALIAKSIFRFVRRHERNHWAAYMYNT